MGIELDDRSPHLDRSKPLLERTDLDDAMEQTQAPLRQRRNQRHRYQGWITGVRRRKWSLSLVVVALCLVATFMRTNQLFGMHRFGVSSASSKHVSTGKNATSLGHQPVSIDGSSELSTTSGISSGCSMASGNIEANRIVYGSVQAAGLLDRREVLRGVLTLGLNLTTSADACDMDGHGGVSVIVPKPSILLSTLHNQDKPVSSQMTWNDLFVFSTETREAATSSTIAPRIRKQVLALHDIQQVYSSAIITSGGRNRQPVFHHDMISSKHLEEQKLHGQEKIHILTTTRPEEAVEHYRTIRKLTIATKNEEKKRRWIWIWALPYNTMRQELSKEFPDLLPLPPKFREQSTNSTDPSRAADIGTSSESLKVIDAPPPYIKELVDNIWKQHIVNRPPIQEPTTSHDNRLNGPVMGYLHIRRGDSVSRCDTTLQRMERYLSCSLSEFINFRPDVDSDHDSNRFSIPTRDESTSKHSLIVLFSSDEGDPSYRVGIRRIVEHKLIGGSHHIGENDHNNNNTIGHNNEGYTIRLIDMDEIIRNELYQRVTVEKSGPKWWLDNNYLIFRIQLELQQLPYSTFLLEQRQRYHCSDCDLISLSSFGIK